MPRGQYNRVKKLAELPAPPSDELPVSWVWATTFHDAINMLHLINALMGTSYVLYHRSIKGIHQFSIGDLGSPSEEWWPVEVIKEKVKAIKPEDWKDVVRLRTQTGYYQQTGNEYSRFQEDLFKYWEVTGPKALRAYEIAWERGHSSGLEDVLSNWDDLVDLLR